ncbi:MAG: hypothetical protein IJG40_14870 [Oscillospiraceae bacterium]|nr:hypothetical protein [Oscillospiraceae bacterium]
MSIGLDIGTTTISSVFTVGKSLTAEETSTLPNSSFLPKKAEWESLQDPAVIAESVINQLDGMLDRHPDTQVIGLTGQMHGILYTGADGEPVSPLFTWQDRRGNVPCFDGKSVCDLLKDRCGVHAYTGYGFVTHLFHVLSGSVPNGVESFCTIGDWIAMTLTGRKKPLLHSSNAASLGLYNVEKDFFDVSVLREFGIREEMIPEVTPDYSCIGTYRGIPVCTAIGDNQASFLGTVRQAKDTVLVNMGTGGQISVFSRKPLSAPGIEARPLFRDAFLLAGSSLCGGRAYAVLKDFFKAFAEASGLPCDDAAIYAVMARLLEEREKTEESLEVCTAFDGTRENPGLRGSVRNISVDNFTPGNLVYGVLSGMADELWQLYRSMEIGQQTSGKQLLASGNGLRKNIWLQRIMSERFGMPLTVTERAEEAACGAAVAGLIAAGLVSVEEMLGL